MSDIYPYEVDADKTPYEVDIDTIRRTWEEWTDYFFEKVGKKPVWNAENQRLIDWIDDIKPSSVLQVGIFFGQEIKHMLPKPYITRVVGVDVNQRTLNIVAKTLDSANNPKLTLLQANICKELPFKNKEFDLACTSACLTHVPPKFIDNALSELLRIGKRVINIEAFWHHVPHPGPSYCRRWSKPPTVGQFGSYSYDYEAKYKLLGAKIWRADRVHPTHMEYFCIDVGMNG